MRIIQLTPGTGSFYCGTCLRDNALVTALRKLGHDALMIPLYLPPALDEAASTENAPVFYGGVNVYLQQKSSLFRKTPRWLDSLLDAPALLKAAGSRAGMTTPDQLGDLTLSTLRGEDGNQAKELDRLVEWLAADGKADVVCLSNILLLGLARRIRRETGAAVVCTLQGEDYFLDLLPEPFRSQCWETLAERARDVDGYIAVSRYYGEEMIRRARLPKERVHPVYNGIALDGYPTTARTQPQQPPVLGFLSRMCALKGLETLVDAYILLRAADRIKGLRLRVAGTKTAADDAYVEGLQARLAAEGLQNETEFLPNISREEKLAFLQGLSVLSVPATYGESFGLYVIEALAAGTPVVQPRHAAFPELLAETGGGLLCEPDDPKALAATLEELLCDPDRALALGEQGRQTVHARFHVDRMAQEVADCFARVVASERD